MLMKKIQIVIIFLFIYPLKRNIVIIDSNALYVFGEEGEKTLFFGMLFFMACIFNYVSCGFHFFFTYLNICGIKLFENIDICNLHDISAPDTCLLKMLLFVVIQMNFILISAHRKILELFALYGMLSHYSGAILA